MSSGATLNLNSSLTNSTLVSFVGSLSGSGNIESVGTGTGAYALAAGLNTTTATSYTGYVLQPAASNGTIGLWKVGTGALTLAPPATDNFGNETVAGGTLVMDMVNMSQPINAVNPSSTLTMYGGTLQVTDSAVSTRASVQSFASMSFGPGNEPNSAVGVAVVVNANSGGGTTLNLGSISSNGNLGSAVDFSGSGNFTIKYKSAP